MSQLSIHKSTDPTLIKFVADKKLSDTTHVYKNMEEAAASPLAQQLFRLPFIKTVVIADNYIALERTDLVQWSEVQNDLKQILEAFLERNKPVIDDSEQAVEIIMEETPNPETMKFVTSRFLSKKPVEVTSVAESKDIPLAFELFEYPFVKKVFISQNYIAITKDESLEWNLVNEPIRDFLREYLLNDRPVFANEQKETISLKNSDSISKQIISLIDQYIKPAVTADGGNIKFESFDPVTKTVNVTLQGACNGCPSADITLKNGIEATLKQFMGDAIGNVKSVN